MEEVPFISFEIIRVEVIQNVIEIKSSMNKNCVNDLVISSCMKGSRREAARALLRRGWPCVPNIVLKLVHVRLIQFEFLY